MAVGSIEPQFYALLLDGLGLADTDLPAQWDRDGWPELRAAFGGAFASRDREHWTKVFADSDACVTPVLTWDEALRDEHLVARGTLRTVDGVDQAAPAPRFSRSATRLADLAPVESALDAAIESWEG